MRLLGWFKVMVNSALIVAFLSIPTPSNAINGLKSWSRKTLCNRLDLCTQPCYSEIVPGLYLSNARAACEPSIIRGLNITHVLTIEAHRLPRKIFADTSITTLFIRALDLPNVNILPYFPIANSFITEGIEKGNVLVHCHYGVSRSATLVIAYMMETYELTFEQAFTYVKSRRRFINPNPGFIRQLQEYERLNYDVSSYQRLEAYINTNVRRHKYKIASVAAVVVGIIVPIVVLTTWKSYAS